MGRYVGMQKGARQHKPRSKKPPRATLFICLLEIAAWSGTWKESWLSLANAKTVCTGLCAMAVWLVNVLVCVFANWFIIWMDSHLRIYRYAIMCKPIAWPCACCSTDPQSNISPFEFHFKEQMKFLPFWWFKVKKCWKCLFGDLAIDMESRSVA